MIFGDGQVRLRGRGWDLQMWSGSSTSDVLPSWNKERGRFTLVVRLCVRLSLDWIEARSVIAVV